ncbi:glycosyltransferase [Paenibacillus sp. ATY16]|uniref:glycosyltransferase family 2 protein n=1 Tax=Paenibacillus sp. ATY16 TaxID=1759312 RepID=UPI00200DDE2D|nr:glycosyltransferase [Paenibacillus sp. ATY16]MCK9860359.1 glycosyltransferase family 2 protein [Paenibacillus sp. ATY16]
MRISVVIPSYKRVSSLKTGLEGLFNQQRLPDEIIVVARDTDQETIDFLSGHPSELLRQAIVRKPGAVAALNEGFGQATGDIIVMTDDDTVAYPDWLERIEKHYGMDPRLGALGGKDWVYHSGKLEYGHSEDVGKLYWFGRMSGNHHIGIGKAREVDILKGANMSFRKEAIRSIEFDDRLKGGGAQVHLEIGICLRVKQGGWRVLYDPSVCVNHYPAERFDEDKRNAFNETACINMAHNETYIILKHSGAFRRAVYLLYSMLVGSSPSPGLLQMIRMVPREGISAFRKLRTTYTGRWDGWKTWKMWSNS